ncbi:MAG: glycosyltransferase family 2 protein [Deltaproteobacteria bacterium]|nr:glycosyltransferase family 2 protein [Deltaproteobacteria bacterium]MBW2306281.1 glycosyltransferase family 2 protein [Deltaproteobacteria bacterium]
MRQSRIGETDPVLLSVVIPTFNRQGLLQECLNSLFSCDDPGYNWELIVVDDASTDNTVSWFMSKYADEHLLRQNKNRGFAAAVNRGIRKARGAWIALINNDITLDPEWFLQVSTKFAPDVGSIATRVLVYSEPTKVDTEGDYYTVVGGALKSSYFQDVMKSEWKGHKPFSASASAVVYNRQALEDAGGFDETLEAYYEDVDLGFRLLLMGWKCVFASKAISYHRVSSSYDSRSYRYHFYGSRNQEVVFWANMPTPLLARYAFSHLVFVLFQLVSHVFKGQFFPFLLGKIDFLGQLPAVWRKRRLVQARRKISCKELQSLMISEWVQVYILKRLQGKLHHL